MMLRTSQSTPRSAAAGAIDGIGVAAGVGVGPVAVATGAVEGDGLTPGDAGADVHPREVTVSAATIEAIRIRSNIISLVRRPIGTGWCGRRMEDASDGVL
jgi:hypothetical protein